LNECILEFTSNSIFCTFFVSSRRRHTRSKRDWSSDVCSSDLGEDGVAFIRRVIHGLDDVFQDMMANELHSAALVIPGGMIMSMLALMGFPRHPMGKWECDAGARSEERRVGKGGGGGGAGVAGK